uniref:Uncharacterized protein n=1 Tax=viral metagenome TaxID=1070528 RepID=A0A2V0RBT4_9ZZZZ
MTTLSRGLAIDIETFVDGDTLVEWPTTPRFWEVEKYAPFSSRSDMISKHHATFKNYMTAHPRAVILFNGGVDFAKMYKADIVAVVHVPFHHLRRNMESRVGEGNDSQPTDPKASDDAQRAYAQILPILRDFTAIREPGLYMAASGAGKSTHVKSMGSATPEPSLYPAYAFMKDAITNKVYEAYKNGVKLPIK